ncbi:peptidoglycan/LPS O-acetylase OafA/YrhL [Sphingobium sp. B2D3B]|uniref:acyltransferase family protein n=1 Tax=Sphingobium sp. B2D3B TaxID=2940580 RepID=UPI002224D0B2|nr:acyltransferase [Sphingobium sp. B2D3B]MCW2383387.1 peptidoglycan/LPS O-acetylase OafA/YrhL [Sphingobium sp. B2D3B]
MSISVDSSHRYLALDSLRGFCACMVVLHHIPGPLESIPLVKNSYLFVDFFFVLSGFVIGTSYGQRLAGDYSLGRYMVQRFFRVWPLHAFMLLMFLAFEVVYATGAIGTASREPFGDNYTVPQLIQSFLLVQPFLGPDAAPWNGPSWSIAVEFWTYLIFALAMKVAPRFIVPMCVAVVIVAPIMLALGSDRNMYVFHDGALTRCLFGFAAGVLLWKAPRTWREKPLGRAADEALEVGAAVLCLAFVSVAWAGRLTLAAPLVFIAVVLVFSRERGWITKALLTTPMLKLGALSYSIYMVHLFIVWRYFNGLTLAERISGRDLVEQSEGVTRLTGDVLVSALLTVPIILIVLIAAAMTHRFIELPGQQFGRKLAKGWGARTIHK